MPLLSLCLVVLSMAFAYVLHYVYTVRRLPPGPVPLPLVGNLLQLDLLDPTHGYNALGDEYGGVFTVWQGPRPLVVITDSTIARQLYKEHGDALANRSFVAAIDYLHSGDYGLSFANGPMWREHRRFALHTLRNMGMGRNAMEQQIGYDVDRMLQLIRHSIHTGQELDVRDTLFLCVGSTITNMVFGVNYDYGDSELARILCLSEQIPAALSAANLFWHESPLGHLPLLGRVFGFDRIKGAQTAAAHIFDRLDEKRRRLTSVLREHCYVDAYWVQREQYAAMGRDDLALLYCERQLRASAIDLFLASAGSVVTTLHWAVGFMCASAASQAKVHAEIDSVLRGATVTMADKCKLPYVNACLMEVQRCANIVYMSNSHCITAAITINGYHVPKATQVEVAFQSMMHSGRYFDRPLEFVPERFYNTDARTNNADKVMPFGIGRRSCPGEQMARQELFMLFTSLMQHFSWRFASKQDEDNFGVDNAIMAFSRKPRHYKVAVEARM